MEGKSHREGRLVHYQDGVVISASTKEPSIASQLYSKTDTSAALNIGRVLALRCLQSGIHFAMPGATKEAIEKSQHVSVSNNQFYNTDTEVLINLKLTSLLVFVENNFKNLKCFEKRIVTDFRLLLKANLSTLLLELIFKNP